MNYVNLFFTTEQLSHIELLLLKNEQKTRDEFGEEGISTQILDAILEQKTSQGVI